MRRGRSQVLEGLKRLKPKTCHGQTVRTYCAHGFRRPRTPLSARSLGLFGRCGLCKPSVSNVNDCQALSDSRLVKLSTSQVATMYGAVTQTDSCQRCGYVLDMAMQTDHVRFRSRVNNQETPQRSSRRSGSDFRVRPSCRYA